MLKPKITATRVARVQTFPLPQGKGDVCTQATARVASVRFVTILSKSAWEETVRKLYFLLLQFVVPVIKFVVVELVPLRGGNEFGTRP